MGGIVCKKIENHTDKSNKNLIISQSLLDHNHEENNGNRPPLHPNTSNLQTVNHLCLDQLSPSTPLKELNLLSYVTQTPTIELEKLKYKYYCPLCMRYFENILNLPCCSNYICFECCLEYLNSKGIEAFHITDILNSHHYFEELACPNCNSSGFKPSIVNAEANIRNYCITPRTPKATYGNSPLKIGDSFEDLKRKMIPLQNSSRGYSHTNESPEKYLQLEIKSKVDYSTRSSAETVDVTRKLAQAFVNNILTINNICSINS